MTNPRYAKAAIILHWLLAALILIQLAVAFYMGRLPDDSAPQDRVEALHISLGLTILGLTLARIAIRLFKRPPPASIDIPRWERAAAGAAHLLFYALMLALPLTGWAMKSLGGQRLSLWGVPGFPSLPGMGLVPAERGRQTYELLEGVHGDYLGWLLIVLIALHVAGALKHQFDGRPVLWRMVPFLKRPA